MPLTAFARRAAILLLLFAAAVAPAGAGEGETLVIVDADVEITTARGGDGVVLPSAARSDGFVRAWPAAAAAALGSRGDAATWTVPGDLRHDDGLGRVLALQEAVASALLENGTPSRPLSLGPGAAELRVATGATHALFARVRATPRRGTAVAMLVDLRDGAVVRHGVFTGVDADADPIASATRVARKLLGTWNDVPGVAPRTSPPTAAEPATPDDVARAAARLERRLRRHPRRIEDPAVDATLRAVACRIDAAACVAPAPIVLAEPGPYAAILPGGALVMHTGLLLRLRDEAELAFVLAHELAHERAGDVRARLRAGGAAANDEAAREGEAAADRDAFARMVAAGYDPTAAIDLWARFAEEERAQTTMALPGSHPSAASRLAAARTAAVTSARGGDRGADRWDALAAPRRDRWRDDDAGLVRAPTPADSVAADAAATTGGAPPRTLRTLGLRLPTRLPWRQRPGIGAVAWTVDGTPLNRLLVVSGVDRDEPLLRDVEGSPRWDGSPGASATAQIAAALKRSGWLGVVVVGERAHPFGTVTGRRAEVRLADAGGLHYRGEVAHAVRDGELTWAVWLAPEDVFHGRDAADVAMMLDGMRFAR